MMYENEGEQYFGYNSTITVEGKRLRRLRRTQVSSEKLAIMRCKSPTLAGSRSSKHPKLKDQSCDITTPLTHNRSKLSIKCTTYFQNGFYRQKHSIHSQCQSSPGVHNFSTQMSIARVEKISGNRQHKISQYYIGSNLFESMVQQSKQRSLSRADSLKKQQQKIQGNRNQRDIFIGQHPQYLIAPPSIPTQKKKMAQAKLAARQCEKPQQIQQKSKISLKESIRSKSRSKLRVSKSNSRFSKKSKQYFANESLNSQFSSQQSIPSQQNIPMIPDYQGMEDIGMSNSIYQSERPSGKKSTIIAKSIISKMQSYMSNNQNSSKRSSKISNKIRSQIKMRQSSKVSNFSKKSEVGLRYKEISKIQNQKQAISKEYEEVKFTKKQTEGDTVNSHSFCSSSNQKMTLVSAKAQITQSTSKKESQANPQDKRLKISQSNLQSSQKSSVKEVIPYEPKRPQEFTMEDVVQNIEEHDIRLGFLYLFVDNTHTKYSSAITFERYERLCFLVLKKYLFQKNRLIKTLRGSQNCLNLTEAEVPLEVLEKFIEGQDVKKKLNDLMQEGKQIFKEVGEEYNKIQKKYQKDRLIKMQAPRDNFSKQIMKLLMQQLTKLYRELQAEQQESDESESTEMRAVEVIQIMFLISQLRGRPVKRFQLLEEDLLDFDWYYNKNYQKIMETAQYFQKLKD